MKKIYKIVLPLVIVALQGCGNKWLDLKPEDRVDSEIAITKLGDASAAVIGIYSAMQSINYYGARMQYYADVIGDDFQANGDTKRCANFYLYAYTAENAPRSLWEAPYTIIRLANNILAVIDNLPVSDSEKAKRDHVKGQALFFRALAHFDITRVYGYPYAKDNGASWGASIITKPTEYHVKPARSTVAECYDKLIIPDLVNATNLLSTSKADGKITKWGAKLLLSRVYLYKGDNVGALREAEECIAGAEKGGYALIKNDGKSGTDNSYYKAWKTKYNTESLYEITNLVTDNPGNDGLPYLYLDKGYDDIILTNSFSDVLTADKNDVRNLVTTKGTKAPSKKKYNCYLLKYANSDVSDIKASNITLLRLSEAYLNAAEAAVKTADNDKAVKYLKAIVERANSAKTVTGTVTLAQVLQERRKELAGEGHRAFDLLRNGLKIERVGPSHSDVLPEDAKVIDWNHPKCILPVPKYEVDANPEIAKQQNPGW